MLGTELRTFEGSLIRLVSTLSIVFVLIFLKMRLVYPEKWISNPFHKTNKQRNGKQHWAVSVLWEGSCVCTSPPVPWSLKSTQRGIPKSLSFPEERWTRSPVGQPGAEVTGEDPKRHLIHPVTWPTHTLTLARAVFSNAPLLRGTDTSNLPRKLVDEKVRRLGVTGASGLEEGWAERSGPESAPERLLIFMTVRGSRSFLGEGNMVQPLWKWFSISPTTTHRCAAGKSSSPYYMLPPNKNLYRKGSVSSWF